MILKKVKIYNYRQLQKVELDLQNSLTVLIAFKNLFNFRDIPAIRELDDHESDTSKGISKRIIALLKGNVETTNSLRHY